MVIIDARPDCLDGLDRIGAAPAELGIGPNAIGDGQSATKHGPETSSDISRFNIHTNSLNREIPA